MHPQTCPPQYSNEIEFILISAVIPDFLHVYVGLICQKYEIILLLLIPFAEILCNPGFEGLYVLSDNLPQKNWE